MAYLMAPMLMTLNDLEGHSPVAGLFMCNPSNICAVFHQISTDSALARSLENNDMQLGFLYQMLMLSSVSKMVELKENEKWFRVISVT